MTKKIVITGSTDGIGKLAAFQFAKAGHHVCIHGRSTEKVDTVISEIKSEFAMEASGVVGDLSSFGSLKKLAEDISSNLPVIDVLINNAGVFHSPKVQNEEGLDLRFMVNYLAPYYLTQELKPLLEKSEKPRVLNLSSAAQSPVSPEILSGERQGAVQETYAQSKLALTMWTFEFARLYPKIVTIAVNPGSLLNTKMVQEAYGQYWSSADKGADILFDLAVNEVHENNSGKYFDNDRGVFAKAHSEAYSVSKTDALISMTEKILKQKL
ncbi:MAG: SDR family NAD(P)-dependent oxidoreductase [Bacteroidota bacterium]